MIHIAICDDNDEELAHIRSMLCQARILCDFTEYTNAEALLFDFETGRRRFDIFLLDIYLPGLSGVDAARRIRAMDGKAVIIFLSSSEDFYREAFDLYAFHYLIKPVSQAELTEVLQKAGSILPGPEESLSISFRGKSIILRHADIGYIDSFNHALCFHMQGGQTYTAYCRFDEILPQLDSGVFVRCHKSFIVNLIHVDKLTPEGFHIGDTLIPISRTYAADAKERYRRRLFGVFQDH